MGQLIQLKEENRDFDFYLSKLKDLSGNDLESINSLILEKIDSKIPLIQEIASHLILSGGKRLRPLLTSCCYNLCKKKDDNDKNYLGLAAAVEFIHAATLLHDDVIDESRKRRGSLTANEIWGNKTSVLVGDFLFSRAFQLMAKYGSTEILKVLADTSVIISEGEILELSNDKNPAINENIYFDVIDGKTASLFSAACKIGAISANTTIEKIEALKSFGTNFGMSFQLIDDAIDYSSSSNNLGKNIGDDFKQGKVTLPIILAYLRSNNNEKEFWKKTIENLHQDQDDFKKAISIIKKYDCIKDTIERAKHFANIAKDSLGVFNESDYKAILINIVNSGLKRVN
tara:strand:+ start:360 stop:1388 length:1029 start_codon:yes stop_codon:yes gene_type:complete